MPVGAALITGISGQDGSYLAELLLEKGYAVHGLVNDGRLGLAEHLAGRVTVHAGDIRDSDAVARAVAAAAPGEVYHLAAATSPQASWAAPVETFRVVCEGTVRLLEAVSREAPRAHVFVAGSSESFGAAEVSPQDEDTPLCPRNPYGAAKAGALAAARAFRAGREMFVSAGIFYNHESERRPLSFVTRKVTWHAAAIARGEVEQLQLGNLDARRVWGYAPEYVEGAWRALQAPAPGDYVFATGVLHSVRDLVEIAFARAGVDPEGRVVVDSDLVSAEPDVPLVGNPARAERELGWRPSVSFEEVVGRMVDHDLAHHPVTPTGGAQA